jgi:thiosulfate/3-mercaptopyruvate sulfurtransferase
MPTYNGRPSAAISPRDLSDLQRPLVILDCRPFDDYDFCHLDGAIHVDVESALTSAKDDGHDPAKGGRMPLPGAAVWEKTLRAWGVGQDSLVVAYDDASGAEGAARAWWMLTASGIHAAVLDGGWGAAVKARLDINETVPEIEPSAFNFAEWLLPTVDIEAVDKVRRSPDWALLDSRAPERWRGEVEPLDPVAGHIPGAINVFYRENLNNGFFKEPEELREMYLGILGQVPPGHTVVSCGSGLMACHTLLALHQAGLEGASLYVGSFSEWCRNRPEEIGVPRLP